jgi:hypothetical protein
MFLMTPRRAGYSLAPASTLLLLALAIGCASLPALRPEPSAIVSDGVMVEAKVEGEALALQIWNQAAGSVSVMPSAIKLLKDRQFFTPEYADVLRTVSPGSSLPLRLRFTLDGVSLSDMGGSSLHLDSALSRSGQRIKLAPFKLTRTSESENVLEGPHVSVLGGYAYNYFYKTAVHGGFAEMRFGGHLSAVELTGRLRVQFGRTTAGRLVLSETIGFGLLGRIHSRVRLGFEVSALPPVAWMFVSRGEYYVRDLIFDAAPELRIDLVHTQGEVLYLSARPGVLIAMSSRPAFASPNILIGIGFGFDQPTLRRRTYATASR